MGWAHMLGWNGESTANRVLDLVEECSFYASNARVIFVQRAYEKAKKKKNNEFREKIVKK